MAKQEGAAQAERPQKAEKEDTTPPGLEHPPKQWGKQEAEAEVKVSSSHEDEVMEKQCGSQEEEPVVMQ